MFKEVTSSLKGWKKKFFLLDHQAIPDAIPWRHVDTYLHDDFSTTYSESDVARSSEFLVPLRPPPRHLLYMCGLTTALISIDTFLKLPTWTRTVLTPFQKNLEKPNPKIAAVWEKKDQQNLAKAEAKRVGAEAAGDNEGLTNKLALVESAHSGCESQEKELMDGLKDLERERDEWRATASNQVEKIRGLEKDLERKTHRLEAVEEKIRVSKSEKLALSAELTRVEADHQKLVREFIPSVVKRLHTSVEYRQSLAASEEKHRELFIKQYPYVQKVTDSYLLPMADLLQVSLDVLTPHSMTETGAPSVEGTDDAAPKSSPPVQENAEDFPFGTTI
nr:hypothetical protein [Tanacetum cinerariifolium]